MADAKVTLAQLEQIQALASEASVKQLAKVMEEYIRSQEQKNIGFQKDLDK